jgi:hypothetical protein
MLELVHVRGHCWNWARGQDMCSGVDGCDPNKITETVVKMRRTMFLTLCSHSLTAISVCIGTFEMVLLDLDWGARYAQWHG